MYNAFFVADASWGALYPGAKAGILVMRNVTDVATSDALNERRHTLEASLRSQYGGVARDVLNELPIIAAYNSYYKQFGKTYHVRSQVESIASGKTFPNVSAVLTSMFMAEVKSMLLTAGHNLDALSLPVRITIAKGDEGYDDIRGAHKTTVANDMIMCDGEGPISSILLGPDGRTKIQSTSRNLMFAVYAPTDIAKEVVLAHLHDIENSIKLFSPQASIELLEVFEAR